MRYAVVNLGCKVNRVESDAYESSLGAAGHSGVDWREADIVIVNTCTVTGEADKKTRKTVRQILRGNPTAEVVVTGCAVAIQAESFEGMDRRVVAVPKASMTDYLADRGIEEALPSATDRVRAGVKIQDGCTHACTYCIVHTARGDAFSEAPGKVEDSCRFLAKQGVPEITLTGINLGSYFRDGYDLADLVRMLSEEICTVDDDGTPRTRLRLSSIEPMDVTDGLIDIIASNPGIICRHLHLPLQSGSDKVLSEMNRPYGSAEYSALVGRIRERIPDISLSTDIIVGFPGETEEDFAETLRMARLCRFSGMHVFPYSRRDGTPAAMREDQIDPRIKERRARELRELGRRLAREDLTARQGSVEFAVVEKPGVARTDSYHVVAVDETASPGSVVRHTFSPCDTMVP